jgi:hypothetical protein
MVKRAPCLPTSAPQWLDFVSDSVLVATTRRLTRAFLNHEISRVYPAIAWSIRISVPSDFTTRTS